MRRIIGTIGATLAVAAAVAATATPASAGFHSFHSGGANFSMGDGSVRFISYSTSSIPTWHALSTRSGGEVVSSDY
jgi:prepilin-type processing-associated H-X9-DG protein